MQQRVLHVLRLPLAAAAMLAVGSCGGGDPVKGAGNGMGTITGVVVQALVSRATVTAYRLNANMSRGSPLASTTTGDGQNGGAPAGAFTLSIPTYSGPLELVADAGSYIDEDSGILTQMAGYDISAVVPAYQAGSTITATISPISTIAASFARFNVASRGAALGDAVASAYTHLNAHFGNVDWRTVVPADLSSMTNLTDAGIAAIILAGFSDEATQIGRLVNGTPGVSITAAMLAETLATDALTGNLDGMGPSGVLTLGTLSGSWQPDGTTARYFLATSILDYVQNPAHGLTALVTQVNSIAAAISANSDPYLFTSPGLTLNLAPPPVTLLAPGTGPGPYYTNSTGNTIATSAMATPVGNGVQGVYAAVSSASSPIAGTYCGTCSPASWQLSLPLQAGTNAVNLYALDLANQGGPTSCVPAGSSTTANCITFTVVLDKSVPAVTLNGTAPATYYDESNMTVGTTVPAVYSANGTPATSLQNGATVHKASSRLAPVTLVAGATDITPGQLEAGNPDNIPWLQFQVTVLGAPLADTTYSIVATGGGATATYTSSLMPWLSPSSSSSTTSGNLLFDLPLDAVRIPLLLSAVGATAVTVTVNITDAAGNTAASVPVGLTYHVIGPPLAIIEDTAYPGYGDPRSTYAYTVATATYATLFTYSTAFLPGNHVRIVRYLVTNPGPLPVGLSIASLSGAWAADESWVGASALVGTKTYYATCFGTTNPCPETEIEYYLGGTGSLACGTNPPWYSVPPAYSGTVLSTSYATEAYSVVGASDGTIAGLDGSGDYLVPAAASGVPGLLAVYVARPLVLTGRAVPLGSFNGLTYQYWAWRGWKLTSASTSGACCHTTPDGLCFNDYFDETWTGSDFFSDLAAASESVAFTASAVTYGLVSGARIGEASPSPTSLAVTRTITH